MRTITNKTEDTALNIVNLILGAILVVSPWILGFSGTTLMTWNACVTGAVIAVVALMAARQAYDWEEWVNLIAGLWAAVSPWALGFSAMTSAMWIHLAIGLVVAVLAAGELWKLYGSPEARSV